MFPVHIYDGTIPEDPICYLIAKGGIFLKKTLDDVESITKVDKISVLEDLPSYGKLNVPKLSGYMFARVVDFFQKVYEEHKSEAALLIYYNDTTKRYKMVVPPQKVSGASVDYVVDEDLNFEGFRMFGTIHSHANMGAFHSGTDDADEANFDGLHITLGHMGDKYGEHSISTSIVINGTRFQVDSEDYISYIEPVSKPIPHFINKDKHVNLDLTTKGRYKISDEISEGERKCNDRWLSQVEAVKWVYTKKPGYTYGKIPGAIYPVGHKYNQINMFKANEDKISDTVNIPCEKCIYLDEKIKLLHDDPNDFMSTDDENEEIKEGLKEMYPDFSDDEIAELAGGMNWDHDY